jgi:type IV secretory pathway component VirB8
MQRYSTKHFWRMKESEDGEFVRYEDVEQLIDDYKAQELLMYEYYKEEQAKKWEERRLVKHLRARVHALYCITMIMMGVVVGKLIGWSLEL